MHVCTIYHHHQTGCAYFESSIGANTLTSRMRLMKPICISEAGAKHPEFQQPNHLSRLGWCFGVSTYLYWSKGFFLIIHCIFFASWVVWTSSWDIQEAEWDPDLFYCESLQRPRSFAVVGGLLTWRDFKALSWWPWTAATPGFLHVPRIKGE